FRETADDDWLKKSELAVTFLDRYGNELGSRGIRHNDAIPLDQFPDHLIKATLATEDRRVYEQFRIHLSRLFLPTPPDTHERARRRRGAGRFLHQPATGQEPVPDERAHHRAQGQGSVPRAVARSTAAEERDPQTLSRPRLSRRRHLRRRCSGTVLFQQVRARRKPR